MRLFITLLSMGSVIAFGYALAGYGGTLVGKGRPDYVVTGLVAGIFCAVAALFLWKKNMHRFLLEEAETPEAAPQDPAPLKGETDSSTQTSSHFPEG